MTAVQCDTHRVHPILEELASRHPDLAPLCSVIAEAENFTAMAVGILCTLVERASDGHEQISVRRKYNSRRRRPSIVYGVGDKNIAHVHEGVPIKTSSR